MPRVGDLLAVRTSNPHDDETHVVIHTVADNGGVLLLSGSWRDRDVEVVVRRVLDTNPLETE
jgi:hypothetical protein